MREFHLHLIYEDGKEKLFTQSHAWNKSSFKHYYRVNKHVSWQEKLVYNPHRFDAMYGSSMWHEMHSQFASSWIGHEIAVPLTDIRATHGMQGESRSARGGLTVESVDRAARSVTVRRTQSDHVREHEVAQRMRAHENERERREAQRQTDLRRRDEERARPRNLWERARNLF